MSDMHKPGEKTNPEKPSHIPSLLERILKKAGQMSVVRPGTVIIIFALLIIGAVIGALNLKVQPTWLDLVPQYDESVQSFNRISETFGAASPIILSIESRQSARDSDADTASRDPFQTMISAAQFIDADLSSNPEHFKQVVSGINRDFFYKHGLMLLQDDEVDLLVDNWTGMSFESLFTRLNNQLDQLVSEGTENLDPDELQEADDLFMQGLAVLQYLSLITGAPEESDASSGQDAGFADVDAAKDGFGGQGREAAEQFIDRLRYTVSRDQQSLILFIVPTCTVNDMDEIAVTVPFLRERVASYEKQFPDLQFRLTGMHIINQDEVEITNDDAAVLTVAALVLIMILFILSFRAPAAPVLGFIILAIGILLDLGITYLVIGRLNLVTSMAALLLAGMGVDFFIHLYSGIEEGRKMDLSVIEASLYSFRKNASGIFLGAFTTAAAFFIIAISKLQLFQEMGFVLGTGLLTTMLTTLFLLPPLMMMEERLRLFGEKRPVLFFVLKIVLIFPILIELIALPITKISGKELLAPVLSGTASGIRRRPVIVLIGLVVCLGLGAVYFPRAQMDYNIMNLEMKGLEAVVLQHDIARQYGFTDGAVFYTSKTLAEDQERYEKLMEVPEVAMVDSFSRFVPARGFQERRLSELRKLENSLQSASVPRLNILNLTASVLRFIDLFKEYSVSPGSVFGELPWIAEEVAAAADSLEERPTLQEMKAVQAFERDFFETLQELILGMTSGDLITEDDIPGEVREMYKQDGFYLTSVYGSENIWEDPMVNPFLDSVLEQVPGATGTILFVHALIQEVSLAGRLAILFSVLAIVLIVLLDLRKIGLTLITVTPLAGGLFLTHLFFSVTGVPYTLLMVTVFPLIIGIGVDNGIHLIHRYQVEGDIVTAQATTGKALFLTSATTVIGFGCLTFAKWQGFYGVGLFLSVGIASCFIATVTLIPALLTVRERLAVRKNKTVN